MPVCSRYQQGEEKTANLKIKHMKMNKLFVALSLIIITHYVSGQNIKDYFIPANDLNKSVFYKPDPNTGLKTEFETIIWFIKKTDSKYELNQGRYMGGKIMNIETKYVDITQNEVLVTKTIVTTMFVTNKEQIYNPSQIFLKLPQTNSISKWDYTTTAGDVLKCKSEWTQVSYKNETKKAIKVTREYYENESVVNWATNIEYYVEGVGLWKIQTYKGEDTEILEKQENDPEANNE